MGILAAGAGASEGLDAALARMLAEEKQKELERSNQVDEALRGRAIDESAASRQAQQTALNASRTDAAEGRLRDDVRANEAMRPAGTSVSPDTYKFETSHGAPDDFFLKSAAPDQTAVASGVPPALAQNDPEKQNITFRGTASELKSSGGSDTNEMKTVMFGGKPVDAAFDPKTKRLSYKGQDITDQAEHYTAPDRTLVQTGDGYQLRSDAAKTLKGGGTVPLSDPATVRTRQDMASRISTHIPDLQSELEEAQQKGLLGPMLGRWQELESGKFGSTGNKDNDELIGALKMDLDSAITGFASIHGRNGANVGIAQQIKHNLQTGSMSYDLLKGGIDEMSKWINEYAAPSTVAGGKQPETLTPYQQYLKRTKK